jgi:hypothetical protein
MLCSILETFIFKQYGITLELTAIKKLDQSKIIVENYNIHNLII